MSCFVEVYSRVTGFFRPVQVWNKGKKAEFEDRKKFKYNNVIKGEDEVNIINDSQERGIRP